jgi:hydroxymethylbilane synthase
MSANHTQEAQQPRALQDRAALPLKIGTRGSPLALTQTRAFLATLRGFCPVMKSMEVFEEEQIRTTGDIVQDRPLAEIGGKGLFSKEIHEALVDGRVDYAVHSLKDLETALPPGIILACTLLREDPRDALILGPRAGKPDAADPFAALPQGAVVGSSSVRRQAQMLASRPDLEFQLLRGNVQRRLDKTRAGDFDATLLAGAGLNRLGMGHEADIRIAPEIMLPACCQGIVGVTVREADTAICEMLMGIEDADSRVAAEAERSLQATLDGSCRTPLGGLATMLPDGRMRLDGLVARGDGSFMIRRSIEGLRSDAVRLGRELGAELRADSPSDIFA